MGLIGMALIFILVPIAMSIMHKEGVVKENRMNRNHFTVYQPKMGMAIGWLIVILMSAGMVFEITDNGYTEWWLIVLGIGFILFGLYAVVVCLFWKLEVKDKAIRCTPLYKKPYDIPIRTITEVEMRNENSHYEKIVLYAGEKKLLSVQKQCVGYNVLISKLTKEGIPFSNEE